MNRLRSTLQVQNFEDRRVEDSEYASDTTKDIIGMLEPLVKESRKTAIRFDGQIKEKKRLLKELNDALDSRIISINLLLSRADALQKKIEEKQNAAGRPALLPNDLNLKSFSNDILNEQHQIIEMHNQDVDINTIAQKLSIPKGEVQLVIDLKNKFVEMEKNGR
jgi:hypothetical protein